MDCTKDKKERVTVYSLYIILRLVLFKIRVLISLLFLVEICRTVRQMAQEQFFLMATRCCMGQRPLLFFITLLFTVLGVRHFKLYHLDIYSNIIGNNTYLILVTILPYFFSMYINKSIYEKALFKKGRFSAILSYKLPYLLKKYTMINP